MIKSVGVILIFLFFVLIGMYKSKKYVKHIKLIEKIIFFIKAIEIDIKSYGYTLSELFRNMNIDKDFFIDNNSLISFNKVKIKECIQSNQLLKRNEKDDLIQFFDYLGTSDLSGQLIFLDGTLEKFQTKYNELKEKKEQKCKLYSGLGILGGAFVAVLII